MKSWFIQEKISKKSTTDAVTDVMINSKTDVVVLLYVTKLKTSVWRRAFIRAAKVGKRGRNNDRNSNCPTSLDT